MNVRCKVSIVSAVIFLALTQTVVRAQGVEQGTDKVKQSQAKPPNPDVEDQIHDLTRQLDEALTKSVREFERLLPQVEQRLRELEGSVEKHGPVLRRRFERMLEELQERLRRATPARRKERERAV